MTTDELRVFREVYDRRSFSAAARSLGLDPSVVSRRIKGLEDRLEVALFLRSTRQVAPTDAGDALHSRVAPALDAIDEAELAARTGGERLQGAVRISAPAALGRDRVGPVVHAFSARHPDVQVHLLLSDRRIDLIQESVDLAVRVGVPATASQIVRKLGVSSQWIVAAPAYLAQAPPLGVDLQTLAGHRVVLRYHGGSIMDIREVLPPELRSQVGVGFVSDEMGATGDAVRAGLGIGVLPSWLAQEDVAAGRLIRLPLDIGAPEAPVYVVLPAGRQTTARARALLDALVAEWGEAGG